MEKKLAEYRAKRAREIKRKELQLKLNNWTNKWFSFFNNKMKYVKVQSEISINNSDDNATSNDDGSESEAFTEELNNTNIWCCKPIQILYYLLWFTLWLISYVIFIKLEFGTVYLIVSALIAMYLNTRSGPKKTNEVSAYSVFNKNCESIDGTLKAEQLERQLIYGPLAL